VSLAIVSLVSVTTIGTFAALTPAYCVISDFSVDTIPEMAVGVASICAVVIPV
jgi:hypothetical protein